MKRVLFILLGVIVLAAIGAAVAIMRLDAQEIRNRVAEGVRGVTGKPLVIQDIPQISFMPLGVTFGAASWGVEPDGTHDPAGGISAAVKSGRVSVQLMPLLSGKVLIDEVHLDSPDVQIRPEKRPANPPRQEANAVAAQESFAPPQVEVSRLSLTNASLSLELKPGSGIRLSGLSVELENLKIGEEMRLNLSTRLALNNPALEGALALKGKVRLQAQSYEVRDLAVRFTPGGGLVPAAVGALDLALQANYDVSSGRISLPLLSLAAQGSRMELAGAADVKTLAFTGTCKVDSAPRKLAHAFGLSLPFKKGLESFKLQSSLAFAGRSLTLDSIQGLMDTTSIDGKLALDLGRMHVAGKLNLGALNLDALLASAPSAGALAALLAPAEALAAAPRKSAPQAAPAPQTPPAAPQTAAPPAAISAKGLPSVDMELSCAALTVAKLQFKDIRARLRGQGLYRIEPLILSLGSGGTVNLNIGVDASAMRYSAAGKVSNVAVGPLLQAMQGKRPVEGTANLDLHNITCAGTAPKAIQASLSGKGLLTVRGIVLNDVSILPKDAPAGLGKAPTHFEQLTVPFTAAAGTVQLAPVTLTSPTANVKGQGQVRLPQENLDFTADVSLLKIATIPVQASGPFHAISYGLDGKRALQMLTQTPGALVDSAKNIGGAALRQGGNAGQKAGDAARGAKDMVKGLFGR